jgi:hypothetical protein
LVLAFTGHPGGHGVGYFVDLGCISFWLDKPAEGFCISLEAVFWLRGKGIGDILTYLRYVCYS